MRVVSWIFTIMLAAVLVLIGASQLMAASRYITLVFEGESVGQLSGKVFKVVKYTDDPMGKVSGNHVLMVPKVPPGEKVGKDEVTYKVKIPETGTYYLWARTFWSTGCGNSFWITVQGYEDKEWILGGDATYDCLHWVCLNDGDASRPRPLKLNKGIVTITLKTRESGVKVDQFLLTTDRDKEVQGVYKITTPSVLVLNSEK